MKPSGVCVTKRTITAYFDGVPEQVSSGHRNFDKIREKILQEDYEGLRALFSIKGELESYEESTGKKTGLRIVDGKAFYNDRPLDNALGKKFEEELDRERPLENYVNFLEKVMQNPSKTAIDELLLFIEAGYMGIEPDGDFLAYKRVRSNLTDCYTGKVDNSPGQIVEMPRNAVDDNRDRTCSTGLHFCSWNYLPNFWKGADDKVVLVKINPADVVSIPSDYNNTKGRTCRYEVLRVVEGWRESDVLADKSFYEDDEEYLEDDEDLFFDEDDFDEDDFEQEDEDETVNTHSWDGWY